MYYIVYSEHSNNSHQEKKRRYSLYAIICSCFGNLPGPTKLVELEFCPCNQFLHDLSRNLVDKSCDVAHGQLPTVSFFDTGFNTVFNFPLRPEKARQRTDFIGNRGRPSHSLCLLPSSIVGSKGKRRSNVFWFKSRFGCNELKTNKVPPESKVAQSTMKYVFVEENEKKNTPLAIICLSWWKGMTDPLSSLQPLLVSKEVQHLSSIYSFAISKQPKSYLGRNNRLESFDSCRIWGWLEKSTSSTTSADYRVESNRIKAGETLLGRPKKIQWA